MQNLKRKLTGAVAVFLILSSCQFNTTRTNAQSDKRDAEKVTNKFYSIVKTKNYAAIYPLFSQRFFQVTSKAKVLEMLTATHNKLGDMQSDSLTQWETRIVNGTNSSSEYLLQYVNHYEKYKATESFTLSKDDDGVIRIVGYNINSEGFFK